MRLLISSVCRTTSKPTSSARPALGRSKPQSIRITVDLPEPLGPRKPKISPASISKLTLSTAVSEPNFLLSPSALITMLMIEPLGIGSPELLTVYPVGIWIVTSALMPGLST